MADRDSTPKPRKNAVLPIPCRACGKEFKPRKKTAKFCSRACQFEGQRTAGQWADCGHCGSRFYARAWQGADKAGLQQYCSRDCYLAHVDEQSGVAAMVRREMQALERIAARQRQGYRKSFIAKRGLYEARRNVRCCECDRPLPYTFGVSNVRCDACKKKRRKRSARAHRQKARRLGLVPRGTHRKRARHHGVPYEPVVPRKVFERDGWRCQICGRRTPERRRGSMAANAPELDHRVPLSRGGPHAYDNVQCACRQCNIAKSNDSNVGQLPLLSA